MKALQAEQVKSWKNGTTQELIPDKGETLDDAINFMQTTLDHHQRFDLFFYPHLVEEKDGTFHFQLWERAAR